MNRSLSPRALIVGLTLALGGAEHRLTYVLVSHDLAVIRAISHRVMVLKDGKIVEEGECENVFANPSSDYTRHLIAHSGHMVQEAV